MKLPRGELAYIWLDRFARGLYPSEVYDFAYSILTKNINDKGRPHFLALVAIYSSCVHSNIKLDFDQCNRILNAYSYGTRYHVGITAKSKIGTMLKTRAKTWNLPPELKSKLLLKMK